MNSQSLHSRRHDISTWIAHRVKCERALFSEELRPSFGTLYDLMIAERGFWNSPPATEALLQSLETECETLCESRAGLVHSLCTKAHTMAGRWLVFEPMMSDFIGLAADPGFVDGADAPAWDLWVCVIRQPAPDTDDPRLYNDLLLSWIPEQLIERFNMAVQLSPIQALSWLSAAEINLSVETIEKLLNLGVLE